MKNCDTDYFSSVTNRKRGLSAKKKGNYTNFTGTSGNPEYVSKTLTSLLNIYFLCY